MAKWGEGDPRWIVEERPDATNVNNWHWTEKNASPWSIDKINELFKDLPVKCDDLADIKIEEVEKCEGEASANNRKGKLIFFYEWDLTIKWSGKLKGGSGTQYSGKINVPNLSEENNVADFDIKISVKDDDEEGDKLRQIMLKFGKDLVRQQLGKYVSLLKEEFSKGMILPKKDEASPPTKPDTVRNLTSGFNNINMASTTQPGVLNNQQKQSQQQIGLKLDVTTVKLSEQFQCKAQEFYDAMTKIEMVTAFTRGRVKLDPVKGGKFELFGGNIVGHFEELVPGKKIVQQWRYKQWPEGHYSQVTFNIEEKSDHTLVNLVQTGVPSGEAETTRENWKRYYWDSMKRAFGFGAFIV